MVVALGTYFDQDVDGVVARLVGEQLEDGGWNCEVENGSVRSSFHTTIRVLEGLLAHERATGGSAESIAARRRGEEYLLERKLVPAQEQRRTSSTPPGCNSRFRPAGTTTCCVVWSTSERPAIRRTRASTKRSMCSGPSDSPTARGFWRTRIPARSTSRSRTATADPAGGTRCARYGSCGGTSNDARATSLTRGHARGHRWWRTSRALSGVAAQAAGRWPFGQRRRAESGRRDIRVWRGVLAACPPLPARRRPELTRRDRDAPANVDRPGNRAPRPGGAHRRAELLGHRSPGPAADPATPLPRA